MAERIDLPTTALILSLQDSPIIAPRDWISRQEREAEVVHAMSTAIPMVSWWTPEEIRACFEVANTIWAQADIRFDPVQVGRRLERVERNERRIYVDLTNRFQRIYGGNVVAGFVESLGGGHGGIAGGHLALVAHRRIFRQPIAFKGTVLAHELGHVLDLPDHVGPNDGNLMYYTHTIGSSRNHALSVYQIERARRRARQILQ